MGSSDRRSRGNFRIRARRPFEGIHTVIAGKRGLFIKDMRATTEIKVKEGWKIEDFAPWYYLKDTWQVKGDFSIPPSGTKRSTKRKAKVRGENNRRDVSLLTYNLRRTTLLPVRDGVRRPLSAYT